MLTLTICTDLSNLAFKYANVQLLYMKEDLLDICGIKRRKLEHKIKMDKAYFHFNLFSMIIDRFSPLISEFFRLALLKLSNKDLNKNVLHHEKLF